MKHLEDERGLFLVIQEIHLLVALLGAGTQKHPWSLNEDHTVSCFVYLNSTFQKAGPKMFVCRDRSRIHSLLPSTLSAAAEAVKQGRCPSSLSECAMCWVPVAGLLGKGTKKESLTIASVTGHLNL